MRQGFTLIELSKTARRGFTLIELLVVVTIIAILISILTPALDTAVKKAEDLRCQTNLRGIGSALTLYLFDHKRRYPRTAYFGMLLGGKGATGYQGVNFDVTERPLNVYLGYTGNGGSVPIAQCPLDKGDALVGSDNAFKGWGNSYIEMTWRNWFRIKKVFGGLSYQEYAGVIAGQYDTTPDSITQNALTRTDNKVLMTDWPIFGDRSYDDPRTRWHTDGTAENDRKFTTLTPRPRSTATTPRGAE